MRILPFPAVARQLEHVGTNIGPSRRRFTSAKFSSAFCAFDNFRSQSCSARGHSAVSELRYFFLPLVSPAFSQLISEGKKITNSRLIKTARNGGISARKHILRSCVIVSKNATDPPPPPPPRPCFVRHTKNVIAMLRQGPCGKNGAANGRGVEYPLQHQRAVTEAIANP